LSEVCLEYSRQSLEDDYVSEKFEEVVYLNPKYYDEDEKTEAKGGNSGFVSWIQLEIFKSSKNEWMSSF